MLNLAHVLRKENSLRKKVVNHANLLRIYDFPDIKTPNQSVVVCLEEGDDLGFVC